MSNRAQWALFVGVIAVGFFTALIFIVQAKPRNVYLGAYPTQGAAVAAALQAVESDARKHPAAASITVHFRGPHPPPEDGEEAFSYNRRLGVLIAFLNRQSDGKWAFVKLLCARTDDAHLAQLAQKPSALLQSPQSCGCEIQKPNQLG